jgi:hypothetical protein
MVLPVALIAAAAIVAYVLAFQEREPGGNRRLAAQHNQAAQEFEQDGNIGEAETEYRNAIIADPRWEIPWNNLGMIAIGDRKSVV